MSRCRKCGAPIVWIRTASGKPMPCDPEIKKVFADGKDMFVSTNGHMVKGGTEEGRGEYVADGRVPHWATCPYSKDFKKSKGSRKMTCSSGLHSEGVAIADK